MFSKKYKKHTNDLFHKTIIIEVIVLTYKNICFLRLLSPENWEPNKSIVSTILLREIILGKTSFSVVQLYSKLSTTKTLSLSHFENRNFDPCCGKDIVQI